MAQQSFNKMLSVNYAEGDKQFFGIYELREPVAMGYADPPEMIFLNGPNTRAYIPPSVFIDLAVTYLRTHGYLVIAQNDMTIVRKKDINGTQEKAAE